MMKKRVRVSLLVLLLLMMLVLFLSSFVSAETGYCTGSFACNAVTSYDDCSYSILYGECNYEGAPSCIYGELDCFHGTVMCYGQCGCNYNSDCDYGQYCNTDTYLCEVCGGGQGAPCLLFDNTDSVTCMSNYGCDWSTTLPTCSDGIQNQGETGIDCGGPCGGAWCSGVCVNLATDPNNCDSCGNVCSSGLCVSRKCIDYVPTEYSSTGVCGFPGVFVDKTGVAYSGIEYVVPNVDCTPLSGNWGLYGCTHRTSTHTCFVYNCMDGSCPDPYPFTSSPLWASAIPKGEIYCEEDTQGGGTGCDWVANAQCLCTSGSSEIYFKDNDDDGYGAGTGHCLCAPDATYKVKINGDCNDAVAAINPGAVEVCNGVDDDCVGGVDDGLTFDVDGDSYTSLVSCAGTKNDCNDANSAIYPGAVEVCNGVDDNCVGGVDDGLIPPSQACTLGVGDCAATGLEYKTCNGVSDWSSTYSGCDAVPLPAGTEVCGGGDEDCDGTTDEEGATGCTTYYYDADVDGYGINTVAHPPKCLCSSGAVALYTSTTAGDCDDSVASIHPGAADAPVDSFTVFAVGLCDGVDSDCSDADGNSVAESEKGVVLCYEDADGDGAGNKTNTEIICSSSANYNTDPTVCNGITLVDYITEFNLPATPDPAVVDWDIDYFDCDDYDPLQYWKCCGAGGTLTFMTVGVPGYWSAVDMYDYPWNVDRSQEYFSFSSPPTRSACCTTSTDCVAEDDTGEFVCYDVDSAWDFTSPPFSSDSGGLVTCGPSNTWLDCDNDIASCQTDCGFVGGWVMPDSTASVTSFGGYTGGVNAVRNECCGDDAGEVLSVGACLASANQNSICCSGPGLYNLDGVCVPYASCPDIMKTAPVWVEYPSLTWNELAIFEASLPNGYCCNSTGADNPARTLCLPTGTQGCYLELDPVAVNSPPARTICATDDMCVLENIVDPDSPFSLCEVSDACTEKKTYLDYDYLTGSVLCSGSYTPVFDSAGLCYPKYDGFSSTTDCEAVDVTKCVGSDCSVLCQDVGGVLASCTEVCESYACTTQTTYRGPGSCTTSTEEVCATNVRVDASTIDIGTCSPASFCNEFGCWANGCSPCTSAGCPSCAIPDLFTKDVVCSDSSSCVPYLTPVGCINEFSPQAFPIIVEKSDSQNISCSPDSNVYEGDVWCPEGFIYKWASSRCEEETDVCDKGPVGGLNIGCDAITTGPDDFWGRYNSGCVWNSSTQATGLNTYDYSCCLNSMLNNYQLYIDGKTEGFVKVY